MSAMLAESVAPPDALAAVPAVDAALCAGVILMQSGASTESSVVAVRQMLADLDRGSTHLAVSGDALIASTIDNGLPITLMRAIPSLGANLERVSLVHALAERVRRGVAPPEAVPVELDAIAATPAPYDRMLVAVALGIAGFAFNQLLGGTIASGVLVFVANAVAHLGRTELTKRGSPVVVTALVTAILATVIAAVGVRLGFAPMAAATFIPAITLLIPGFALINGLLDLSTLRYVMVGVQRLLIALLTFLVIGIGIATGIALVGG